MRTLRIPRADWPAKLSEFSTVHDGWRVSLEILAPTLGAQPEIVDLPLRGIAAEIGARDSIITIAAGWKDSGHVTHTIHAPRRVQIEQDDTGTDMALEVESSDHARAILRIMAPARPETVDGMPRRA